MGDPEIASINVPMTQCSFTPQQWPVGVPSGPYYCICHTGQPFMNELEHGHAACSPDDRWRNYFGCLG